MQADYILGGWSFQVRPLRTYLLRAEFNDHTGTYAGPIDTDSFMVRLAMTRPDELHLGVALTVELADPKPLNLSVTYAVDFEMQDGVPIEERTVEWRKAAYLLAPALLFPYVREMFSNLTARWRGEEITLPFAPVPFELPTDESGIPDPPTGSASQGELPLTEPPDTLRD